jgi:hypothetical protein
MDLMSIKFFVFLLLLSQSTIAQFYLAAGETIKISSPNVFYVMEDLVNNSTIGYITLSGGNAQNVSGTGTITHLVVDKSAGTATVSSGRQTLTGTVTLTTGTLDANDRLTLKSDVNGTARVLSHSTTSTLTGKVTVERYIDVEGRNKHWRSLGFPYSGNLTLTSISGMSINTDAANRSVMYFNESADNALYGNTGMRNAGYVGFSALSENLPGGRGVLAWLYGNSGGTPGQGTMTGSLTISSSGTLNEDGNAVSLPVYYTTAATYRGWNLVSNPFASNIDWQGVSRTNIDDAIYRWDPQVANWTACNSSGGNTGGADRYIESGGAFFVHANAANPVLTVPQSAKTGTATTKTHFSRNPYTMALPSERAPGTSSMPRLTGIRIKASGMGNPLPEENYIDISQSDATEGFDTKYDAGSMARSSGTGISLRDKSGKVYVMQFDKPITEAGSEKRYYPLIVTTPQAGSTNIELTTEGNWNPRNSISLIDQQEQKTFLMSGNTLRYAFRMDKLRDEGRFLVAINHVASGTEETSASLCLRVLGNPVSKESVDILVTHPTAMPKRWVLTNASGQTLHTGSFTITKGNVQYRIHTPGMRITGQYQLQVEMDNGEQQTVRVMRK